MQPVIRTPASSAISTALIPPPNTGNNEGWTFKIRVGKGTQELVREDSVVPGADHQLDSLGLEQCHHLTVASRACHHRSV